jgi:uncharacterized membrane protein
MTQSRWTSKAAWAALLSFIGLIFGNFGLYEKIGITAEVWQNIVTGFLATMVALGIFNDPTSKDTY